MKISGGIRAALHTVLFLYVIALILWPKYLAWSIGGLFFTPQRLLALVLTFFLLVCFMYAPLRLPLREVFAKTAKHLKLLFLYFMYVVFSTIAIGANIKEVASAVDLFISTAIPALAYIALAPQKKHYYFFSSTLLICGLCIQAIVIYEMHLERSLFQDFATSSDLAFETAAGKTRDGLHRAMATFVNPLSLVQFNLYVSVMAVYNFTGKLSRSLALVFLILAPYTMLATGSRSAIPLGVAVLVLILVLRALRSKLSDFLVFTLLALGAALGLVYALDLASIANNMFLTGSDQALASTTGRLLQYSVAIEAWTEVPFLGVGKGQGLNAISSASSLHAVDNLFLLILLEHGGIGLALWMLWIVALLMPARGGTTAHAHSTRKKFRWHDVRLIVAFLIVGLGFVSAITELLGLAVLMIIMQDVYRLNGSGEKNGAT